MKRHSVASFVCRDGQAGVRIMVDEPCTHWDLQMVGEHVAEAVLCSPVPTEKVFVWVYGPGMNLDGPAALLTYQEGGKRPFSSYTDVKILALFYHGTPVAEA